MAKAQQTEIYQQAQALGTVLAAQGYRVATAESCTGGWLAKAITDIAGSSQWFDRGFVTYTDAAKQQQLAVADKILTSYGAVSEETVMAMAKGVLRHSDAVLSVAISGIAGPGGGSEEKPVGLVWFAWAKQTAVGEINVVSTAKYFTGDREAIRACAVLFALEGLIQQAQSNDMGDL